ncbi:hypothetical protein HYU07_07025, partial [Candidatus Woesearchaeota archaeon]|nr:hypothetical protein [Candidatus Woesearchaeota archaeon]
DELAACTKTADQQIRKMEEQLSSARAEFGAIQVKVSRGAYDNISDDVKDLAARLEKINYSKIKELIEEVKSYTYIELIRVDAMYEKRLVRKEHNEAVLVEPERTERVSVNHRGLMSSLPGLDLIDGLMTGQAGILGSLGIASEERYVDKKIPAKYESKLVPAEYEDVLVSPKYYKKIKVHPYSGKEWVIEDPAPKKLEIKSEREKKESKKDINSKVNYSWGK